MELNQKSTRKPWCRFDCFLKKKTSCFLDKSLFLVVYLLIIFAPVRYYSNWSISSHGILKKKKISRSRHLFSNSCFCTFFIIIIFNLGYYYYYYFFIWLLLLLCCCCSKKLYFEHKNRIIIINYLLFIFFFLHLTRIININI